MAERVQMSQSQTHPMRIIAVNRAEHAAVARIDEGRQLPAVFQQIQASDIRNRIDDSGNIPIVSDGAKNRF